MGTQDIKLTVRLPKEVHDALKQRAGMLEQSLNQTIIAALLRGLAPADDAPGSDRDALVAPLQALGLWAPDASWLPPISRDGVAMDHAALRRAIGAVPPLSEIIMDDRGTR